MVVGSSLPLGEGYVAAGHGLQNVTAIHQTAPLLGMILDGGCQVDAAAVVKQRGFHIRVSVQPGLVVGHAIIQIRGQIIDHAVVAQGAQVLGVEAHIHDIGVVAGTKHQGHLIGFAALGRNLPVDFDVEHILPVMDHCAVTIVLFGIGHVVALLEHGVGQLLVVVS